MRILAVTQPSGVGYHRILLPLTYLKYEKALATDVINDDILANHFDIFLINRYIPGLDLDTLLSYRKKYGFKLIVDIDDYWHLDPWHIIAGQYPTQTIIDHIKAADLVTCTHERLRGNIRPLNNKVAILPNALPYDRDQFTDVRTPGERIRFGWTGGATHYEDLRMIKNPMRRIFDDTEMKARGQFVINGYDEKSEVWRAMVSLFKDPLLKIRKGMGPYEYMNLYNDIDVALAPLVPSNFNCNKSNLKVLEAAAKRIPIITSAVHPYTECPWAIKISHQSEWFPTFKRLIKDKTYREEMGEANAQWARTYYDIKVINKLRQQYYEDLIH